jgi:DNA replication protein DnaC
MPKGKKTEECPLCEGYGYIISEAGTQICECQHERLKEERLRAAKIPQKFLLKSLDNFKPDGKERKQIVETARHYIQGFRENLRAEFNGFLIIGPTGAGKSHIAIAILKEVVSKGYTGLYYNVPELLTKLRETYDLESEKVESEILEETETVDLLVLDDLGAERTSGWVRDRLYLIINRRYERGKPTIVTTNCEIEELGERVGERITSRLYEMCAPLDFPKQDYRMKFARSLEKKQKDQKKTQS